MWRTPLNSRAIRVPSQAWFSLLVCKERLLSSSGGVTEASRTVTLLLFDVLMSCEKCVRSCAYHYQCSARGTAGGGHDRSMRCSARPLADTCQQIVKSSLHFEDH